MTHYAQALDGLATILSYPGEDYKSRVAESLQFIAAHSDAEEMVGRLYAFSKAIEGLNKGEMEELYTRTFDINPVSSLEVGWHLYGETYERGAFLVQMRNVLRRCGVEESTELPDHLTSVLHAVGRMERSEAEEFIPSRVLKAMAKMLEGFAGQENPYEHVLVSVQLMLTMMIQTHEGVES
ncbi:MAG: molecular chaperone TorD family protein [Bacteroidetes bacterium]|nr:molecular chaperone TorD family protein [Bacteroidota bacterium]MCW5896748.1 molecular chaperone TorD family protein [Bacteroidota bacterium]